MKLSSTFWALRLDLVPQGIQHRFAICLRLHEWEMLLDDSADLFCRFFLNNLRGPKFAHTSSPNLFRSWQDHEVILTFLGTVS